MADEAGGTAGAGAGASRAATSSSAALNAMGCMAGSPFVALRQISLSASSGSPEPWKNVTASGPEMAPEPSVAFVGESRVGEGAAVRCVRIRRKLGEGTSASTPTTGVDGERFERGAPLLACWNAASIALGSVKHACSDAGSHWNVDMFGEARAGKANAPAAEDGRRLRTSTATRALELCTRLATARDCGHAFHESVPTGSAAPIARNFTLL